MWYLGQEVKVRNSVCLFPFSPLILHIWLSALRVSKYIRSYGDRENDLDSVSKCLFFASASSNDCSDLHIDLRSKFSAIHREYSPNPRKFYAFCTSVTDTATTAGIIASGAFGHFFFWVVCWWRSAVRDMVIRQHLKQSKLLWPILDLWHR